MVVVQGRRCSYEFCTTQPNFNVEGSKTAVFCRQHAKNGMVNVFCRRCSDGSCSKGPSYNFEGIKTAAY